MPDLESHYNVVVREIVGGRVVPFLGAGVNLAGRSFGSPWQAGQSLPSGGELSTYLAESFHYPGTDPWDLVRVAQYIALVHGSGPLYEELHRIFNADYPATTVHRFFAELPRRLREKGLRPRHQLIVTTNYDDVLERSFGEEGQDFDLITYVSLGGERGRFLHWPPSGDPLVIEKPNEYTGLALDEERHFMRPVILKIHGAIDRVDPDRDSYVITEDDYIDYLTRSDVSSLLPATIAGKLKRSNFLFLGYGLRDWNLRVILHRIWGEQKLTYNSWAILLGPTELDRRFWGKRDVEIFDASLEEYMVELAKRLEAVPIAK